MIDLMKPYDDALEQILNNGKCRTNVRTGQKTLSIFGMINRYKLDHPEDYFPILTRRKIWSSSVFKELLWFISGSTNNNDLLKMGCKFWTPWVDKSFEEKHNFVPGSFGPVYGFQLRYFGGEYGNGGDENYGKGGVDQLSNMIERIKKDYSCRRTLWTLWNPKDLDKQRLPPCHFLFQILVDDDRKMTGILYQRSCDFPIGVPANIQFYSTMVKIIAQQTDCTAEEFVHVTADSHIYENQLESIKKYLTLPKIESPKLKINKAKDIFSYTIEDFTVSEMKSGPKLDIPVAV